MADPFGELSRLNLRDHGDAREQQVWPAVANSLSEYETFWRTLIVLLTNRIDPNVSAGPERIRVRAAIPRAYEQLAMHNYSLFYYAATARQGIDDDRNRLGVGAYPHPERVFFSLQASVEQAKALQIHACTILSGLDIYDKPPKHPELVYQTIGSYRNAFAHNPVLGRAVGHGRELLPPETRLPKHNKPVLWREFANIPMEEMVDLVILEEGVWQEFATFLQKQWQWLTETFLRGRNDRKFIAELGLTTLLPIHPAEGTLSVTNPIAASGTSIVPGKKT